MRRVSRRRQSEPGWWGSAFGIIAAYLLFFALFSPVSEPVNHGLAFDRRPAVEIMILIGAVALLRLCRLRLPAPLRYVLAALVFLAGLLNFADAVMPAAYGREIDLYWDLRLVPGLIGLSVKSAGLWRSLAAFALALIAAAAAYLLILLTLVLAERATARRGTALAAIALAAVGSCALALPRATGAAIPVRADLSRQLKAQADVLYGAWEVAHGQPGRYAAALAAPQPASADLAKLKHRDVLLIFFEAYGTVLLDNPQYRAAIAPALARFAEKLEKAGIAILSNRILSPSFGGGSWLAHGEVLSGVKLDQFLSRLILDSRRKSLPRYMEAAGYRTVDVEPGIKSLVVEDKFWGFDQSYYSADLGYRGPEFGWFGIPDQFTLKKFATRELRDRDKPVFAQIVLVSSHTPFYPVPPYRADWADAGDYAGVSPAEWEHIYRQPDWNHLEKPFLEAVAYDLDVLGDFVTTRISGGALVVILGDEQPPAFISGEHQPWTVPIYVLSRDPDLLAPFAARGYTPGVVPEQPPPWPEMAGFMPAFLADFSSSGSEPAAPTAATAATE